MRVKIQQHALYFKGLSTREKSNVIDTASLYHLEISGKSDMPNSDYVEVYGKDDILYKLLFALSYNYDIEII